MYPFFFISESDGAEPAPPSTLPLVNSLTLINTDNSRADNIRPYRLSGSPIIMTAQSLRPLATLPLVNSLTLINTDNSTSLTAHLHGTPRTASPTAQSLRPLATLPLVNSLTLINTDNSRADNIRPYRLSGSPIIMHYESECHCLS